jgi:hypothetical protein
MTLQDRPAGGDHHDHEDEQRFGEVAPLHVIHRGGLPAQPEQRGEQHEGPEAEDHLDLAEQVPQPGMAWLAVGQAGEQAGGEGVQDGHWRWR